MAERAGARGASIDHVVMGAASLDAGVAWASDRLGCPPGGGGAHPTMGTVNALWRLGHAYLEVIAIDAAAPPPGRPRWFGLDDPDVAARLAARPRLLTWVARPGRPLGEAAAASPVPAGPVERHHRGALHWHLTVPEDGRPRLGGALPALIEWPDGVAPPPERLPENGLRLVRLALPDAPGLGLALAALGLGGLVAIVPGAPGLEAVVEGPVGRVVLD